MSLELEIEKIRAVRRGIAQQFDFDVAKLGEYYRKQELPLNSAAQAKPASSEAKDGTEAARGTAGSTANVAAWLHRSIS